MSDRATHPALRWLQARQQWVCWRREERQGKRTKIPYNARTGQRAESNNPATWTSYAVAQRAYERSQNTPRPYEGFGYMFGRDITGVDLDHCIDADGQIEPWAQAVIHRLASYAERSPGDGIHIYVRGTIPKGIRRAVRAEQRIQYEHAAIEMYCEGRYFTVTGAHIDGTPVSIESNQNALDALYAELIAQGAVTRTGENHHEGASANSLDDALLKKAVEARNGEKFRALFYEGAGDIHRLQKRIWPFACC
jgi:putative DNA primase/helicase